jgi:hypothetical protein
MAEAMSRTAPRPETNRAFAEKAAASAEAAVAMQSSLALASMRAWFAMAGGTYKSRDIAKAQSAAVEAALRPIAKRVSANHRRLTR